ncbi:hypothetical protein O6H91_20G064200 [Diphasiastrum complanatum]|uniref:Uncharacterized protein n=1 Tax=Diphasiastrum complanatum TaxID=34168 RepID=A0ACC2ARC3_DIPCM|nr:hypothetical protein O6H91_20G064200 [Diphasiastrum complanatum]
MVSSFNFFQLLTICNFHKVVSFMTVRTDLCKILKRHLLPRLPSAIANLTAKGFVKTWQAMLIIQLLISLLPCLSQFYELYGDAKEGLHTTNRRLPSATTNLTAKGGVGRQFFHVGQHSGAARSKRGREQHGAIQFSVSSV